MEKIQNKSAGFTLIEILIVISIIGVLSALTLVGMSGFRASGRDAKRVSDIRQVQNGLELYYAKNGVYPDSVANNALPDLSSAGVKNLPTDPLNTGSYVYKYFKCGAGDASGYSYVLSTKLESSTSQIQDYGTICNADCLKTDNMFCIPF
jgi:general secretion pathway protein G